MLNTEIMDEYNSSLIENKTGTTGKTTTDSDTKQYKMNLSPIKNSTEDSPLRRALEQPPLKRFKVIISVMCLSVFNTYAPGWKNSGCRYYN